MYTKQTIYGSLIKELYAHAFGERPLIKDESVVFTHRILFIENKRKTIVIKIRMILNE